MTTIDASGFATFFSDVHPGRTPFPWQDQLTSQVLSTGRWPDLIDVPTGLGKTSMLDVAIYVLACSAGVRGPSASRRRTFFVVDRRLVVDEAYEHALKLEAAFDRPHTDMLRAVRRQLLALQGNPAGDGVPLAVTRMRGGTTWDSAWVDRPDQAAIVIGTVDQVGSRMLLRGYATSDYRKPMDAALVGTDSLVLVDEAHLAQPMLDTSDRLLELDPMQLPVRPMTVVRLTATPRSGGTSFDFDVDAHLAVAAARERLEARKSLRLAVTEAKRMPQSLAALTVELLAERPGARALVVCNTVSTARQTHAAVLDAIRKSSLRLPPSDGDTIRPELVIGRARAIDRDAHTSAVLRRFGVDRSRGADDCVDVLVATQTVEVGANLDVDVLVTESAPLNSLVQRLGRLNRLGRSATTDPVAVIVDDGGDDYVYGPARRGTWDELVQLLGRPPALDGEPRTNWESIQAGPLRLRQLSADMPQHVLGGDPPTTPMLNHPILRAWARTSPRPEPDTPVGPYLHGLDYGPEPVTLFWRDDLFEDEDEDGSWNRSRLDAMPFTSVEAIELPLPALLAWVLGDPERHVADVDAPTVMGDRPAKIRPRRRVVVRRGDGWRPRDADQIRGGDIVAVPADWGGLDEFGWNPTSRVPVIDVRDVASMHGRRARPALRIDARTCERVLDESQSYGHGDVDDAISELRRKGDGQQTESGEGSDLKIALIDALTAALDGGSVRPLYRDLTEAITSAGADGVDLIALPHEQQHLLRVRSTQPEAANDAGATDSSAGAGHVTLGVHHAAVGVRAHAFCVALDLPGDLTELVVYAAEHHDLGKIDVRFQAALTDGNTFMAELLDEPLAKSGIHPYSSAARDARRRSGLPRGYRHEAWSARLVQQLSENEVRPRSAIDLVAHLVASHHGRGRPLLPPVVDDAPKRLSMADAHVTTSSEASVDFDAAARFERLNDRFGVRGLALLETIVRCADQTCSAEGS